MRAKLLCQEMMHQQVNHTLRYHKSCVFLSLLQRRNSLMLPNLQRPHGKPCVYERDCSSQRHCIIEKHGQCWAWISDSEWTHLILEHPLNYTGNVWFPLKLERVTLLSKAPNFVCYLLSANPGAQQGAFPFVGWAWGNVPLTLNYFLLHRWIGYLSLTHTVKINVSQVTFYVILGQDFPILILLTRKQRLWGMLKVCFLSCR